jgi:hypothetical protein
MILGRHFVAGVPDVHSRAIDRRSMILGRVSNPAFGGGWGGRELDDDHRQSCRPGVSLVVFW